MDILMPQLGETVAEGKITAWLKTVGDTVAPGDTLFEIETDKTSMDVPTTIAGVLTEIRVAAGATVPVGSVVAVLSGAAASAAPKAVTAAAASPASPPSPAAAATAAPSIPATPKAPLDPFQAVRTPERNFGPAALASGVRVTPVARRLADEMGVALTHVAGSGPHGRIVARDIRSTAGALPAHAASAQGSAHAPTRAPGATAGQVRALYAGVPFEEIALDGMRRTIARRLEEAKQTIPHFYLTCEISLDRLADVRSEVNAQAGGSYKLSINDFIIRALALALQRVPEANAVWAEDRILRFRQSDVSVAVAVEGGLYTPVIRNADTKSLSAISAEMKALSERARHKTLKAAEYQGGSISISNLGMFGIQSFAAIVNPPQAAILAVGAAERRPFERTDGSVGFRTAMTVTLSCDHRVIDGVLGAKLLSAFRNLLEAPLSLFTWTA